MLTKLPWLGPLIVFGLVVFVHELGHFLAAKAFRVYRSEEHTSEPSHSS